MKHWFVIFLCLLGLAVPAAQRTNSTRVPPPGLAITETNRAEQRAGADLLAQEIAALRVELKSKPTLLDLLPDVEIFHKAVDWALRYDEFYRSNEVGLARGLLKQGQERARQLRAGTAPWLTATGLVVRGYVSKIDGSVQPYGLVVPSSFGSNSNQPCRLDVWLHGRDNNLTELKFIADRQRSYGEFAPPDTFVLHPYGRYCNAFKFAGETDVFEAMEHVQKSYRINDRRIALRGFSMGGAGAWHLAAHHPDVWAVAAPGAGFAETAEYQKLGTNRARIPTWEQKLWQLYDATDYAANFANLPVVAYNGTDDPQRQAADVMERAMQVEGLTLSRVWGTNVGHKYTPEGKREVSRFVDDVVAPGRLLFPDTIHFTTRSLRFNLGPGIEVLGLEQHWQRADVTVRKSNGRLWVTTTNITRLSLLRPAGKTELSTLNMDGQTLTPAVAKLGDIARVTLIKDGPGRWSSESGAVAEHSVLRKSPGLQGPIDDAFMDSFLIVRPMGKPLSEKLGTWVSARLHQATNDWRAQFRGDARVKDDGQVTEADIATHNLVLFGDPQSNRLLARLAEKLPIQWNTQTVQVGGKTYSAASHVPVFIFPNPLNPQRYVVLNTGFTFAAAGTASNAQQTPKLPDYVVLDVSDQSVVLADFFDEQWRLR